MGEKEIGKELLQSGWLLFLLILPIFLIAKGLFDVNMKCLFRDEFYWVIMMMFKIKTIITLLFLEGYFFILFFIYFYNDNVFM